MTTVTLYDQAYPNLSTAPHVSGALAYIGGDTPHVWTDVEIRAAYGRYRLPTYVRSNPQNADPVGDAGQALAWLAAHNVPKGTAVVLDLETAINAVYVLAFGQKLHQAGYLVWVYGSKSTIFHNPALDGYFVADYTQSEHQYPGAVATQWADPGAYDVEDTNAVSALWDYAPPAQSPVPTPQEDDDMAEVWNDGAALYLFAGGWLTHLNAADEGSDFVNAPPAGFTAQPLPYRKVTPDLTQLLLSTQAARTSSGSAAPAPSSFPHSFTVTTNS